MASSSLSTTTPSTRTGQADTDVCPGIADDGVAIKTAAATVTFDAPVSAAQTKKKRRKPRPPIKVTRKKGTWANDPCKFVIGNITFDPPHPLLGGKQYSKREALRIISKTRKGSGERAAMIKFMIDEGYVPVKSKCFYDLIRDTEIRGLPVGDDNWNSVGRPTREVAAKKNHNKDGSCYRDKDIFPMRKDKEKKAKLAAKKVSWLNYKHDDAKPSLWGKRGWKGSIVFRPYSLAMITYDTDLVDVEKSYFDYCNERDWVDICSYIGGSYHPETNYGDRIYRIYFNLNQFPPPENLGEGGSCSTFVKLSNYIHNLSCESGSPVTCNGNEGENGKRFSCAYNREARKQPNCIYCPFGFTVKWDDIGYYIHLMKVESARMNCNGCQWHLCLGK